jgi:hypothetical protein
MALLQTLFDNFDDNSLDPAKWSNYGSTHVNETQGQLRITTSAGGSAYYGIVSLSGYDLTASYSQIEIVSPGLIKFIYSLQLIFSLNKDSNNYINFTINGYNQTIEAQKSVAGVFSIAASVPYSSLTHRFLRFRQATGTVFWEYSSNGTTWSTLYSVATPFVITSLFPNIEAGTFNAEKESTTVVFDNYNIVPIDSTASGSGGSGATGNVAISNPINVKSIDRKYYSYKVYDTSNNFIGQWKDAYDPLEFTQEINSPGPAVDVEIARSADTLVERFSTRTTVTGDTRITVNSNTRVSKTTSTNAIGSGTDIELKYKVEAYVHYGGQRARQTVNGDNRVTVAGDTRITDIGAPNGRKKFSEANHRPTYFCIRATYKKHRLRTNY